MCLPFYVDPNKQMTLICRLVVEPISHQLNTFKLFTFPKNFVHQILFFFYSLTNSQSITIFEICKTKYKIKIDNGGQTIKKYSRIQFFSSLFIKWQTIAFLSFASCQLTAII